VTGDRGRGGSGSGARGGTAGDGSRRGPSSGTVGSTDRRPTGGDASRRGSGAGRPGGSVTGDRGRGVSDGRVANTRGSGDRHGSGHSGGHGSGHNGGHGDRHAGHHNGHGNGHHGDRHGDYRHRDRHHNYYYGGYRSRPYWWTGLAWYGLGYLQGGYGGGYYGGYYTQPYYSGTVYTEPYAVYDVPIEEPVGSPVDNAVPLEDAAEPQLAPAVAASGDESERFLVAAEDAFRAGRYEQAQREIHHALVELPGDGRAMLFLAQTLFATEKYQQAIGATYQGMSLLDEKDWGFVAANYDKYYGNDDYVAQTKKLGAYIKANPKAAYAYALRGYHWGYLGYPEAARKDLAKAVELEPRDEMAAKLLVRFGGKAPKAQPKPTATDNPPLPPPPVDEPPLKLKGSQ
jgi:tetratricopeptide (TPR) repeat protein